MERRSDKVGIKFEGDEGLIPLSRMYQILSDEKMNYYIRIR